MSEKLWLPFDAAEAVLATVGGKGESLAAMARVRLPVPGGFHLTTAAYRRFVAETGAAEPIKAALAETRADDPAGLRAAAARIQPLFTTGDLPDDIRAAILAGYASLGGTARVAVRSSATAEDLPDASFAGQMESYLNVSGAAAVVDAVRRCWASLWTDRAIEYRARTGADTEVALAVVVQLMVDAEAAGVAFTADPLTGDRSRTVVNATWGLGESLVSGQVTPDSYTVADGAVVDSAIGDKEVETLRTATGTRVAVVPVERRAAAVLDDAEVLELAAIAERVAGEYGRPMDIEWALAEGRFQVVQARPITNLPEPEPERETWNDSRDGDYLWTSANIGEAIPSVMTPMTWSLTQTFMSEAMALAALGEHRLSGNIGGRFYLNLSLMEGLARAIGFGKLMASAREQAFGALPEGVDIPGLPMSRWAIIRAGLPGVRRFTRTVARYKQDFHARVAAFPGRCDAARAEIAAASDAAALRALWESRAEVLLRDGGRLLAAGSRLKGTQMARIRPWLRKYTSDTDANAMLTGLHTEQEALASMGPLVGLAQLADGEIDRDTFATRWGHRCPDEFEVSVPRPGEDPAWVERRLAGLSDTASVADLLARQETARAAAMRRFTRAHPGKVKRLNRLLADAAAGTRGRETGRSEAIRSFWVLRAFVLRAAELTGVGDDVFFLDWPRLLRLLEGDTGVLEVVPKRRAAYEHYRSLPVYPTFIRGGFDPRAWAADPDRRGDVYDATGASRPASDAITGGAGSPGTAEGVAVVVDDPDDGHRLAVGDILVTKVTNIGWTPIFPRAAAVVTDVGAVLSHAAIVARELGIPAVVGCGTATARIRTGDRIRVDGDAGTVTILRPAGD